MNWDAADIDWEGRFTARARVHSWSKSGWLAWLRDREPSRQGRNTGPGSTGERRLAFYSAYNQYAQLELVRSEEEYECRKGKLAQEYAAELYRRVIQGHSEAGGPPELGTALQPFHDVYAKGAEINQEWISESTYGVRAGGLAFGGGLDVVLRLQYGQNDARDQLFFANTGGFVMQP